MITSDELLEKLTTISGISKDDFFSKKRNPNFVAVRVLFSRILHEQGYTKMEIKDIFNCNYSSVYHYIYKYKNSPYYQKLKLEIHGKI